MKICIIGATHLGLQTAYDILRNTDNEVVMFGNVDNAYLYNMRLEVVLEQANTYAQYILSRERKPKRKISFTSEVPDADVYWYCLDTHLNSEGSFHSREIDWVINKVNELKLERNFIVINSSMVPVGINLEIAKKALGEQYRLGYAYVPGRGLEQNSYNHNWNLARYIGTFGDQNTRVMSFLKSIYHNMPRSVKYLEVSAVELIRISDVLYRSVVSGFLDEMSMIAAQYKDQNAIVNAVTDIVGEHHSQSYPVTDDDIYPGCGEYDLDHHNAHAFISRKLTLVDSVTHSALKTVNAKKDFVVKRITDAFRLRLTTESEIPTIEIYGITAKKNLLKLERSMAKAVVLKLIYENVWSKTAGLTVQVCNHIKIIDPYAIRVKSQLPVILQEHILPVNEFTYRNKVPNTLRVLLVDHDEFEIDATHENFDLIFVGKYYRG